MLNINVKSPFSFPPTRETHSDWAQPLSGAQLADLNNRCPRGLIQAKGQSQLAPTELDRPDQIRLDQIYANFLVFLFTIWQSRVPSSRSVAITARWIWSCEWVQSEALGTETTTKNLASIRWSQGPSSSVEGDHNIQSLFSPFYVFERLKTTSQFEHIWCLKFWSNRNESKWHSHWFLRWRLPKGIIFTVRWALE